MSATRRAVFGAALAAGIAPIAAPARAAPIAAQGAPGPGKILVWVDERAWTLLITAATALGPHGSAR